jgi:galactan endo-beta-1,3-galactanase
MRMKLAIGLLAVGLLGLTQLQAAWTVGYPWGRTHNGTAYMTHGGDVMTATQPGQSGYKYNSGTSYSTTKLICTASKPTMGASAYCNVSARVRGVWPAFWMTSEGAWTSELDIAEWKGSNTCWQNTYDGGWESTGTSANNATFKVQCTIINTAAGQNAVRCQYYINSSLKATHTGSNFRNKNFWLIRDLQMEGSSGSPGPTSARFTCSGVSQW